MFQNTVNVPIPSEYETVTVTSKKKINEPNPGYTIWGNGKTTKGGTSVDLLDIMKELRKPEITLMQFFRDEMETNQVNKSEKPNVIEPTKSLNYDKYLKTIMKKYYAHMECLGIIKRIHRGKYMVNPRLYIPYDHKTAMFDLWDSLDKTNCDDKEV